MFMRENLRAYLKHTTDVLMVVATFIIAFDLSTTKLLSKVKEIKEFNIGHFLIGESIFFGLSKVIRNFKKIINN